MSDTNAHVLIDGADQYNAFGHRTLIENVFIQSASKRGAGVRFLCDAAGEYIYFVEIRNLQTWNTEYGITMDSLAGSGINGNNIFGFYDSYSNYPIYMDRVGDLSCNMFYGVQIQAGGACPLAGVYCEGWQNYFDVIVYDTITSHGTLGLNFTSGSRNNYIRIMCNESKIVDEGTNNTKIVFGPYRTPALGNTYPIWWNLSASQLTIPLAKSQNPQPGDIRMNTTTGLIGRYTDGGTWIWA